MHGLIVNFTPTGMILTKQMTPHVPVSPREVIDDVKRAWDVGITMVHLHARDAKSGEPTHDKGVYAEIIAGIREYAPELILCVSLSGRNIPDFERRAQVLSLNGPLKPDMGSLTLSSLNFNKQASINEPSTIARLAQTMLDFGIRPELEVFDVGMINYAKYLERKGMISPPYYFNLIVGNIACAQPDLLHVGLMLRDLPADALWSLGAIGDHQLSMNSLAIAIDGGVRVGLEDNIWFDTARTRLASNLDLLDRIHVLCQANGRPLMTSAELRELLFLHAGCDGRYGIRTSCEA